MCSAVYTHYPLTGALRKSLAQSSFNIGHMGRGLGFKVQGLGFRGLGVWGFRVHSSFN